jgi:Ribosomal protein L14
MAYRRFILTPLVLKSLPRGARSAKLRRVWEAAEVDKKWGESAWAKKREAVSKRRSTTDFERFEIALLRRQRSRAVHSGASAFHSHGMLGIASERTDGGGHDSHEKGTGIGMRVEADGGGCCGLRHAAG